MQGTNLWIGSEREQMQMNKQTNKWMTTMNCLPVLQHCPTKYTNITSTTTMCSVHNNNNNTATINQDSRQFLDCAPCHRPIVCDSFDVCVCVFAEMLAPTNTHTHITHTTYIRTKQNKHTFIANNIHTHIHIVARTDSATVCIAPVSPTYLSLSLSLFLYLSIYLSALFINICPWFVVLKCISFLPSLFVPLCLQLGFIYSLFICEIGLFADVMPCQFSCCCCCCYCWCWCCCHTMIW